MQRTRLPLNWWDNARTYLLVLAVLLSLVVGGGLAAVTEEPLTIRVLGAAACLLGLALAAALLRYLVRPVQRAKRQIDPVQRDRDAVTRLWRKVRG